jgi:hypothetical protein
VFCIEIIVRIQIQYIMEKNLIEKFSVREKLASIPCQKLSIFTLSFLNSTASRTVLLTCRMRSSEGEEGPELGVGKNKHLRGKLPTHPRRWLNLMGKYFFFLFFNHQILLQF